jgi:hypothetical protein
MRILMNEAVLASQAARLSHRRRQFMRDSVTLPVAPATHAKKLD